MRLKNDAVSPLVATVLMIAITVVLAAVLYTGSGHGPTYWIYLGPACEMNYTMQFNSTEFQLFCENNSLQLETVYSNSAHGQFNLTQGREVDFRIRNVNSYSVSVVLEAHFNDSGRICSISEAEVNEAVAEHYDEDRESFSEEVEYFKVIFKKWFHVLPDDEKYFPVVGQSCLSSNFENMMWIRD